MSYNNEKLPWILILAGSAILTLRLIIALFSSLSIVDWFAIIIIISGLILLIMNNNNWIVTNLILSKLLINFLKTKKGSNESFIF